MRKPAVRAGLIFGLSLVVLRLLDQGAVVAVELAREGSASNPQAADQIAAVAVLLGLASFLLFLVYIGVYLWAGAVASRATGSVSSGALAGLLAAVVASLVGTIVNISLFLTGVLPLNMGMTTDSSPVVYGPADVTVFLTIIIVTAILSMALDIGLGAGVGALGGLIGKSMYDKAHPAPYAGFPGIYPPPGTPGMYPPPGPYGWYAPYPAPGYYPAYPAYPPPPGAPWAAPAPAAPPPAPTSMPAAVSAGEQQSQPDGESSASEQE